MGAGRWRRSFPVGAEIITEGAGAAPAGVHFRVWAPTWRAVQVVIESPGHVGTTALDREPDQPDHAGYFSGFVPGLGAGARYRFRLGEERTLYPDPASRFQPDGPFGPSEVIDPDAFPWSDAGWQGIELPRHVFYEMHVGSFTPEGSWAAAAQRLPELAELGVTTVEMMPIADFAGRFGWGYDGVDLYAPTRLYGRPDDLRRFVDRAHGLGMAVILDVVYNHVGPAGNFLFHYAPAYRSERYANEWGEALNFDGEHAGPVREFVASNAACWISEYHLDGLRLDATQQMFDSSREHIIAVVARRAREAAAGRHIFLVGENEEQKVIHVRPPESGGYDLDALWNDDFHHSARVAATGCREAYYSDYRGSPQELIAAIRRGFLYQGQIYPWQQNPRGTPVRGLAPQRFVTFLQNHDQVANTGAGERLHELTSPGRLRALTALCLLSPGLPLLFQGQEWASSRPWRFFADHEADLAQLVAKGRAEFMRQFPGLATAEGEAALRDPSERASFEECVLEHGERERGRHRQVWELHRDLLALRRTTPVFTTSRASGIDGAVLGDEALCLRYFGDDADGMDDRLLLVNLGRTLSGGSIAEPLIAPPADAGWELAWSSEHPRYGGHGTPPPFTRNGVHLPAHAALLVAPRAGISLRQDAQPRRTA
jgi:maltooligosyltrehalose trehalohydrolase